MQWTEVESGQSRELWVIPQKPWTRQCYWLSNTINESFVALEDLAEEGQQAEGKTSKRKSDVTRSDAPAQQWLKSLATSLSSLRNEFLLLYSVFTFNQITLQLYWPDIS